MTQEAKDAIEREYGKGTKTATFLIADGIETERRALLRKAVNRRHYASHRQSVLRDCTSPQSVIAHYAGNLSRRTLKSMISVRANSLSGQVWEQYTTEVNKLKQNGEYPYDN